MAKGKWKAHPYADLFPMMSEEELEALADDIAEHGLLQPIVRYQDLILDGRNRLLACERADVDPRFEDFTGSDEEALSLVESLNAQRRDLMAGQKAIVAAKVWLMNGDSHKRGPRLSGFRTISVKTLAKRYKTDSESVIQARDLLEEAPDLAERVSTGSLNLAVAYKQHEDRQKEAEKKARDTARIAKYREAVSNGDMTFEEALQKVMDEERAEDEKAKHAADARQLFLSELTKAVEWTEKCVTTRTDDYLAWYLEAGAPGAETKLTAERLEEAITQLSRVLVNTFQKESNHVKTRSSSHRQGKV